MSEPVSASDFVAAHIRQSILNNELKPGSQIKQHKLAAELGVSHVPLREAIQKLEAEGFLTRHPRRGAFVRPLSANDVKEIFDLRIILETDILKKSIPNLDSEQIQLAQVICAKADQVKDIIEYGEINNQFHLALYSGINRPRQISLIKDLWKNKSRYSIILRFKGNHFERSQATHWDILKAASKGDVELACRVLENHISTAAENILAIMKKAYKE